MNRRALFMATGVNRGAWYAGLPGLLTEVGIDSEHDSADLNRA